LIYVSYGTSGKPKSISTPQSDFMAEQKETPYWKLQKGELFRELSRYEF
jgi:hypothetical protein